MIYTDRLSPFLCSTTIHGHVIGIRWYGLSYLLGFLLAYLFYRGAALRGDIPGFNEADVDNIAIRIVAGVMIGGRLGFVVQHPRELFHNPLFLISIWQGGMAFFGGLAGVILAAWSFAWQKKISFLSMTDLAALPAALALGIGRIANFANGELYGKPTHSNWGVIFPGAGPLPRHPSQLYESAAHLLIFGVLYTVYHRWRDRRNPGAVSFLFLILYGLTRTITDFWRQDDVHWGPLSDGQWFSLAIALGGAISLWIWRSRRVPPDTISGDGLGDERAANPGSGDHGRG